MSTVADLVGTELGPTGWLEVTQERVDEFARATDDPQWIHTDPQRPRRPVRARSRTAFTLSLCVPFLYELMPDRGFALTINYGVNRVRFRRRFVGSRIRARLRVDSVDEVLAASKP